MMAHGSREESRYQALLSGEGVMKALFKTIKMAAGGEGLGRVFITGVSPVAMSDLTSPGLTRLQKFDFRISMLRREFFLYGTAF
uniref:Uncharacterized protein n=1 Tax=Candidatus Kentrum sp. DK TaxID=2126562 RepID=A0A450RVC1_9GAMM|nr:MAG: hypothetical protein BECKDK2373B_GA0170837_100465 [Candidatus Kentron sp. DK]